MANTNTIEFSEYFNNLALSDESKKFVILLGSGFHNNNGSLKSIINDWDLLLKSLDPNFEKSGNYLLDFEKILSEQESNDSAQKTEYSLLKCISNNIKKKQIEILKNQINNYPSFIFNPNFVTDVVSLNFDILAENLCKILFKAKLIEKGYIKVDDSLGNRALIHKSTRYRIFKFPNDRTITFWYPHGSILDSSGMILSARKYGQHIASIETLRKYSKSNARKKIKINTWYDKLTHNPVLILGASVSSNEWDIWSALASRERNFFKPINNPNRDPIFQMQSYKSVEKCKYCDNQFNYSLNEKWFQPLFTENLPFEDQWKKLDDLFKQK